MGWLQQQKEEFFVIASQVFENSCDFEELIL